MKNIRLVAFDLDGTLIDSRPDLAAAINKAIAAYSFPPRRLEEFNQIVGNGHHTAIIRACPEGTDEAIIDSIQESYLTDYDENCCVYTTVYDGIIELTEELRRNGIKMAILTNKIENTAEKVADFYFRDKPFSIIQGNRAGMPLKPDPAPGLWVCGELNIRPEETVYVGDSGSDMTFAKNAGFLAVGAGWGFRGREELLAHGADFVIHHPSELLQIISAEK